MPQTLSAVPDLKAHDHSSRRSASHKTPPLRSYHVDKLDPVPTGSHTPLFGDGKLTIDGRWLIALTVILVLGFFLIGHFAQVGAFVSDFLHEPAASSSTAPVDPVVVDVLEWLPILLVCLSAMVLACVGINRVEYLRRLRRAAGPELVPLPVRPPVAQTAIVAESAASIETLAPPVLSTSLLPDARKLFIVGRRDERHEARESVRLERDAHASASARAAAAARLVISDTVRIHQSEALVVPPPPRSIARARAALQNSPSTFPRSRDSSGSLHTDVAPAIKAGVVGGPLAGQLAGPPRASRTPPPATI